MTELEKIEYAKQFISKLAKGINPLDDSDIPDSDLLNNVKISRCMFYVSDILQKISDYLKSNTPAAIVTETAEASEEPKEPIRKRKKKSELLPFHVTLAQLNNYEFENEPIGVSKMTAKLNALVDLYEVKKLKTRSITKWLEENEMVSIERKANGACFFKCEQKGEEIGIITEHRRTSGGRVYPIMQYTTKAQRFILDHIDEIAVINNYGHEIIISNNDRDTTLSDNSIRWDAEQEEQLIELFNYGLEIDDIATEMKRTSGGIKARLKRLGLIK